MTEVQQMADWLARSRYEDLSPAAVRELKIRVLDAIACAAGAIGAEPVEHLRRHNEALGGAALTTAWGLGGQPPDRAALYNGFLVRYLDYNDSYLAPKETCHPSDNIAPVLAASEMADAHGRDFLTALAAAYQVQIRLSEEAPVRSQGFDHTSQGTFGAGAGVGRALGLDAERLAHAIAISGTAYHALRVTRTGALSHWKGLAYPSVAFTAVHAALLAREGITGPPEVFEGNKGFRQSVARQAFSIDWAREDLEKVTGSIIKKYNAEIHSQASLEGLLELRAQNPLNAQEVVAIELDTFDVAYHIIGGGEEGGKKDIRTKEEADHSLPYMLAVALLDGDVGPAQYTPERIAAADVQQLLQKVEVREKVDYSGRFPQEMPCRIRVRMQDGSAYETEKTAYEGFHTRPAGWGFMARKLEALGGHRLDADRQRALIELVQNLEAYPVRELTALLKGL
jgi:2-methylcitrate dehydratase